MTQLFGFCSTILKNCFLVFHKKKGERIKNLGFGKNITGSRKENLRIVLLAASSVVVNGGGWSKCRTSCSLQNYHLCVFSTVVVTSTSWILVKKIVVLKLWFIAFLNKIVFYFFQFYFLYFLREKNLFNKIERNKKINFTTFLAPMKIGIIVENRSCKKRTWMDFSLIHGFFLRSLIHWKSWITQ